MRRRSIWLWIRDRTPSEAQHCGGDDGCRWLVARLLRKGEAMKQKAMATDRLPICIGCGHPPDWHRLTSDAVIQDPTDDAALFRCLGYDCEADGPVPPGGRACDCANYEGSP